MASHPSAIATKSVEQPARTKNLKHTSPYVRRLTGDWGVWLQRNHEHAKRIILKKVQGRLFTRSPKELVAESISDDQVMLCQCYFCTCAPNHGGPLTDLTDCFKPANNISNQCTAFSGPACIRCHQVAKYSIIRHPVGDLECQPRISIWLTFMKACRKPVTVPYLGGLDRFCIRHDVWWIFWPDTYGNQSFWTDQNGLITPSVATSSGLKCFVW